MIHCHHWAEKHKDHKLKKNSLDLNSLPVKTKALVIKRK